VGVAAGLVAVALRAEEADSFLSSPPATAVSMRRPTKATPVQARTLVHHALGPIDQRQYVRVAREMKERTGLLLTYRSSRLQEDASSAERPGKSRLSGMLVRYHDQ
jgi:hypothetical protein